MSYSAAQGNETVQSVKSLFTKLERFKLSSPELLMIANIRPEGYAHLTPLLIDADSRFDEDQLYVSMPDSTKQTGQLRGNQVLLSDPPYYPTLPFPQEMLGLINDTLEKRPKPIDPGADGTERTATETSGATTAAKSRVEDTAMKQTAENMALASIAPKSQAMHAEHAAQCAAPTVTTVELGSQRVSMAQSTQNMAYTDIIRETQEVNTKRVKQAMAHTTSAPGGQGVLVTQEEQCMASMDSSPKSQVVKTEHPTQNTTPTTIRLKDRNSLMTPTTQNTEYPADVSGVQGVKVKRELEDMQRPIAAQELGVEAGAAEPHANRHAAVIPGQEKPEEGDAAQSLRGGAGAKGVEYVRKIKQEKMEDR